MRSTYQPKLQRRKRYLQIAFNSTLANARQIISRLPVSDRIILEAGTPLIKRYGMEAIRSLRSWYAAKIGFGAFASATSPAPASKSWLDYFAPGISNQSDPLTDVLSLFSTKPAAAPPKARTAARTKDTPLVPYVVADMKTIDRGETEVQMVAEAGASAAIAMGSAPIETLNTFIAACESAGIDSMIDMMNVQYPVAILNQLKRRPVAVIVHRGVDEERDNREKQIPFYEIQRIKGSMDVMVSIAGGDTSREVQRAVFNDADIVVIWKSVYTNAQDTIDLVNGFLKDIR